LDADYLAYPETVAQRVAREAAEAAVAAAAAEAARQAQDAANAGVPLTDPGPTQPDLGGSSGETGPPQPTPPPPIPTVPQPARPWRKLWTKRTWGHLAAPAADWSLHSWWSDVPDPNSPPNTVPGTHYWSLYDNINYIDWSGDQIRRHTAGVSSWSFDWVQN